ncbi:hypothetical protein BASA50_008759 [Batrachochytrium salamandrivorans]|uniref:Uncharacterized protein n=1 Tax=Batrachochytrium salamandrivorans TaxID=1357716 RepID=A0ABQ8F369_9FUNG|nr:hypothetical protein BASA50_008759 [Batrachochytrium salamandrivorans]
MDARVKSWKEMGDGKARHKRSKYRQEFYQNQEDEYRRLMQTAKGKKQHYEHIRRLEEMRRPNRLDPILEDRIVTSAYIHDPLEPGPKIIKTESPEHLKSGLKKGYTGPVHGRKVGFKPVVKLALYDRFDEQSDGGQSDDEDPSQSQDFTEGTTDTTGEQSDNQPTFETHEIPINDPGYYW